MTKHALWLIAGLGCAHSTTAPVHPAVNADMTSFSFYVGHWSCRGAELDDKDRVVAEYPLAIDVEPLLDGSWLSVVVAKDGAPVTTELKGYSPADRRYHHVWATGGGAWGSLSSDGWHGDEMTFVDDHPTSDPERMVFTRISSSRYAHRAEVQTPSGWHTTFRKTCDKTAS